MSEPTTGTYAVAVFHQEPDQDLSLLSWIKLADATLDQAKEKATDMIRCVLFNWKVEESLQEWETNGYGNLIRFANYHEGFLAVEVNRAGAPLCKHADLPGDVCLSDHPCGVHLHYVIDGLKTSAIERWDDGTVIDTREHTYAYA